MVKRARGSSVKWLTPVAVLSLGLCLPGELSCQPIAAGVSDTCSLVRNGGFEEGKAMPTFWRPFPPKPEEWGSHKRDTEVWHSGTASGLLTSAAPHPPGKAGVQWNRYGIEVESGASLIVSCWVKTEGVGPGGAGCHFYDADGSHLGFVPVRAPASAREWTYVRQEVAVPDETKTMGFALYGRDEGKTWFDDVAVIGAPEASAVRGTPVLDGKLGDECWAADAAVTAFAVETGQRLATAGQRAWLAYDDEHLYMAFECPHPEGARLRQQATAHDEEVQLDDSIEVFLDPRHEREDYCFLCVNCAGVIHDAHQTETSWESGARAAVARGEEAWTVEVAIPFEALDIDMKVGDVWGINLVHNDRVRGETSTWSLGGPHNPRRFGNVGLSPDLSRFYPPYLVRELNERERRAELLREGIQAAHLPRRAAAEPLRLLEKAEATIAGLRAVASGKEKLPEGGWETVRRELEEVTMMLGDARRAAISGLFEIGDTDKPGSFRVAIADSLCKVPRSGPVANGPMLTEVRLDAARDESESFQLVVIPTGGALSAVQVEVAPLTGPGGEVAVEWHRVDYVETAEPGYRTEYVGWWPDPLLPPDPFDVKADERQPLWFTASVPPEAAPGTYTGEVRISHGDLSAAVPVELRVRNFRLPRPGTLATAFGLYASALSRWWYGKEPYRESLPIEVYARWCEFLGKYRLTPKNIARDYLTQTQDDDGIHVDMSNLQRTVEPLAATYFAPYSFCVHRLPTRDHIGKAVTATDPEAAAQVVEAYVDEWECQRLPREVYIYGYDEPRPEHYPFMREAYRRIKEVAPDYPIMQTISDRQPDDLVELVDIWCPLTPSLTAEFYRDRVEAGDTLWTYTCCSPKPPHANFFIDEPAIDHRILFWQTWQAGATGFLYWCVCYWHGLPNAASGEACFPDVPIHMKDLGTYQSYKDNGDGVLVYPGKDQMPLPSIRLEVIRDGIEDYEYLALLSRLVAKAKALPAGRRPGDETLNRAEELCTVPEAISETMTTYTKDPARLLDRRRQVAEMLEELTALL